jgi:ATP-dependent Clp protease protease subunit
MQYIKPDIATYYRTGNKYGRSIAYTQARRKRFALPHSRIMIHQPIGGFYGQATDVEIHAREMLRMKEVLNNILIKHSGQSLEKIRLDTERDYFMSGEEAKDYGIIDEVIKTLKKQKAER